MDNSTKKQFATVDEYIALQPESMRAGLTEIRQIIKQAIPDVEELISYQMPGYRYHGKLVWFAANKNHYGLYVPPGFIAAFKDELSKYSQTKSAIHLPVNQPIPAQLITKIVQHGAQKNQEQELIKKQAKKKK
ncbi:DUF1801 domain-containing protein [Spirosoma sp. BT702]|uniref:DUF1801 domain-containing protein n=1 Tax=Spirosoma profusum TaxID=2771354 RepID=A0A926XW56_9BACT|nr:DUF1801 domain-containing protein [Spirosoma profusum]MBD2701798.1 DUF1801 domain-containing protein [Spirosoma profusum]